jgi:hypothetical protein
MTNVRSGISLGEPPKFKILIAEIFCSKWNRKFRQSICGEYVKKYRGGLAAKGLFVTGGGKRSANACQHAQADVLGLT